jgi:hypothetical protein
MGTLLILGGNPVLATVADDLCPSGSDPCTIPSGTHTIDDGSVLDFGTRHVILNGKLDVGTGHMQVYAGEITMNSGGKFFAQGNNLTNGGSIYIDVVGDFEFVTSGLAAFDLTGKSGGSLQISSDTGNVRGRRRLSLQGTTTSGDGGTLDIFADGGAVELNDPIGTDGAEIIARGGNLGYGGEIEIFALGDVTLAEVDASGGEIGGGLIEVDSDGAFTAKGSVNLDGGGTSGAGGAISVETRGGPIRFEDEISATGAAVVDGGDGGELFLDASDSDIILQDRIEANSHGWGCAGSVILWGRDIQAQEEIQTRGTSAEGCGTFDFDITATGSVEVLSIKADAGNGGGAFLSLFSSGPMTIGGPASPTYAIDISASGTGGMGGDLVIHSSGPVTIDKGITADGSALVGIGGDIRIEGCTLTLLPTATLSAKETLGSITLRDGAQMDLSGSELTADPNSGVITLQYLDSGQVPITTGTTFDGPTPVIMQDPNIPDCDLDDDGVLNIADNCPHAANPSQEDNGGIGNDPPDGIGDACQCGDVTGDGKVNSGDATMITRKALGLSAPAFNVPCKCDVTDVSGDTCNSADATMITRMALGLPAPLFGNHCGNYTGGCECDGAGNCLP